MKPKIYVETSIPSFYYETRTEPEMVARREWTRQFWDEFSQNYILVTSLAVLDELNNGDYPMALASFHKCDFLLTWNCKHLANANKFGHIRRVNSLLDLHNPLLVTPLELLGGTNEQTDN